MNLHSNDSSRRFILFITFLLFCWSLSRFLNIDFDYYRSLLQKIPVLLSGFVFIALYVGVTFFVWLTKDLFKVLGAVMFGPYLSTLLIWIAEMINVILLFNLSRYFGRDFIKDKIKGKMARLETTLAESGAFQLFALRIVPLVPFRFLDLLCGLTKIRFKKYFAITLIASPLRIFWVQFILAGVGEAALRDPSVMMNYLIENNFVFLWSFLYFIAAIIIVVFLRKKQSV